MTSFGRQDALAASRHGAACNTNIFSFTTSQAIVEVLICWGADRHGTVQRLLLVTPLKAAASHVGSAWLVHVLRGQQEDAPGARLCVSLPFQVRALARYQRRACSKFARRGAPGWASRTPQGIARRPLMSNQSI